ncbi:MAG: CCA tRNA nucleotidyltransferase [Haloarculaceae archaeon]
MSDEFSAVVERVRERVTPDADERERLRAATDALVERTTEAVADLPVDADVLLVGSTARDTWLAGDRDVDLFVRFPPALKRGDLESYGLTVGQEVLPDGREEYAEHPYTVGEFEGFTVDLVPCYDVPEATEIQSAVDRTPFHTQYLEARLTDDRPAEVRVAKAFLKGIGVYGSDLRTEGFSGYLTELLVLEYGGFRPFVAAAADWHPPVELDPADHGRKSFDDPVVMIDPTDPERNVAAALSATNVARLQHYARDLLADPRAELFEPDAPAPLDDAAVRGAVDERGTTPVAVRFDAPDVVDDQLWPQLRKSLAGVTDELDRRGFDVLRAAAWADDEGEANGGDESDQRDAAATDGADEAVLFAELAVAERPVVERHDGPPVHVREHAEGFYEKYADTEAYGPFIAGERYVVEREREFTTARAFLESDALFDVALGTHVEQALADGYAVLVGDDVAALADAFGVQLARYFSPKP